MGDIIRSGHKDLVIRAHRSFYETRKLLPAARGRKGMEGGERKHLSSVRHLLPQMTQSDCGESLMERSPFTITVATVDSFGGVLCLIVFASSNISSRISLRLCPRTPQMPPGRKPPVRRTCSAPSNLQLQPSRRAGAGRGAGGAGRQKTESVRNGAEDKMATLPPPDASERSTMARLCAFGPSVMPLWC